MRPFRPVLIALVCAAVSPAAAAGAVSTAPASSRTVEVRVLGPVRAVPRSWLGFSAEWDELAKDAADPAAFARMLSGIRVGSEPVRLRVGGETADETYWPTAGVRAPDQSITLTGSYFQALGLVARTLPLRVLVDLNLAARSPRMAVEVARRTLAALPAGSLSGFEIGNEPDLYSQGLVGNHLITMPSQPFGGFGIGYTAADYRSDLGLYVRKLRAAVGPVGLAGPAMATDSPAWAHATRGEGANTLTFHRYQFGSCLASTDPKFPTMAKYLSTTASSQYAARSIPLIRIAHAAGEKAVISEFGSSFCGGVYGVTDTFATALWAADTLLSFLKDGVDGVDAHLRFGYPNSAFIGTAGGFHANPLYYGMVAVARVLTPGGELQRTGSTAPNVPVWVVRARGGALHVLAINTAARPLTVLIRDSRRTAPGATAELQTLTAPGPAATGQVTFAGRSIDDTGHWQGRKRVSDIRLRRGAWRLHIGAHSAALLISPSAR